jgi:hypothetical protein
MDSSTLLTGCIVEFYATIRTPGATRANGGGPTITDKKKAFQLSKPFMVASPYDNDNDYDNDDNKGDDNKSDHDHDDGRLKI